LSQLLSRLQGQLAQATDPTARAALTARISCLHSRVGHFTLARQLIADLRRDFGDGHDPRASVWIMLAEGLCYLYSQQYAQALDRLTRAQFLGVSMRYSAFISVSSAWRALIDYHESRYEAMCAALKLSLDHLEPDDLDTQTRICLIVALGYRYLGERESARQWFMRGHHFAVRHGDQAAIEALLYNSAAGAVDYLRVAHAAGQTHPEASRRARFELESAKNLNLLTQASAMLRHLHLQDGRLKMLEGRHAEAAVVIAQALRIHPADHAEAAPHVGELELQYCAWQQGDARAIERYFERLAALDLPRLPLDDQICAAAMARELAQAGGRSADVPVFAARLESLLLAHQADAARLADALAAVTATWTPTIALQANDNIGDYY